MESEAFLNLSNTSLPISMTAARHLIRHPVRWRRSLSLAGHGTAYLTTAQSEEPPTSPSLDRWGRVVWATDRLRCVGCGLENAKSDEVLHGSGGNVTDIRGFWQ